MTEIKSPTIVKRFILVLALNKNQNWVQRAEWRMIKTERKWEQTRYRQLKTDSLQDKMSCRIVTSVTSECPRVVSHAIVQVRFNTT